MGKSDTIQVPIQCIGTYKSIDLTLQYTHTIPTSPKGINWCKRKRLLNLHSCMKLVSSPAGFEFIEQRAYI